MNSEFQVGPIIGADGKEIADDDVLLLATEPKKLTAHIDGMAIELWAQRDRVTFQDRQAYHASLSITRVRTLIAAGFTEADEKPGGVLHEDANDEARLNDPRWERYVELRANDEEVRKATARLAAPAIIVAGAPGLRYKARITPTDLLTLGYIGDAIAQVVVNFITSSKRASREDGETETTEATVEPSETAKPANGKTRRSTSVESGKASQPATS